jgi:hypothetical protein
MTEQEFGETVASPQQIGADVFTTPQEIACGFFVLGRNMNGGQGTGAKEHRQLTGIRGDRF